LIGGDWYSSSARPTWFMFTILVDGSVTPIHAFGERPHAAELLIV
jgi:hypothetical protein